MIPGPRVKTRADETIHPQARQWFNHAERKENEQAGKSGVEHLSIGQRGPLEPVVRAPNQLSPQAQEIDIQVSRMYCVASDADEHGT
jgi:hypothetical protein